MYCVIKTRCHLSKAKCKTENVIMAVASSEGSPITPISLTNSTHSDDRNYSRSPSLSSVRDFPWPSMLVSPPGLRKKSKNKGKFGMSQSMFIFRILPSGSDSEQLIFEYRCQVHICVYKSIFAITYSLLLFCLLT